MQTQAEQAAWELSKDLNIPLVTILPSLTLGPILSKRGGYSADSVVVRFSWITSHCLSQSQDRSSRIQIRWKSHFAHMTVKEKKRSLLDS
jgi:hypothetical protein